MRFDYSLSYFECQSCTSRIHCKDCVKKLYSALERFKLAPIEADIEKSSLSVDMDEDMEDDVIDALENVGFFAE